MKDDKRDRVDGQFPYIKLFPEEYQGGSLHYGCSLEERGFFVDLMCLAAKNRKERGTLSLEKDRPMTITMIANALFINEADCQRLLKTMEQQERIHYRDTGVIVLTKFEFYQKKYRRSHAQKEKEQKVAIKRTEEARLRQLVNKYPGLTFKIVQTDFGYDVLNKKTGELLESVTT